MKLNFRRKLSKSAKNKAATITIPRTVAHAWKEYDFVDITFDGRCLVIVPCTLPSDLL